MTVVLIVFAVILLLIAFILSLRIKLFIKVIDGKANIYLKLLNLKKQIYPESNEKKSWLSQKIEKALDPIEPFRKFKREISKGVESQSEEKLKPIDKLSNLLDNSKVILSTFKTLLIELGKRLKVKIKRFDLSFSAGDPSKTAIMYPLLLQSLDVSLDLVEEYTNLSKIKERNLYVEPNFLSEKSEANIDIILSISFFGILRVEFKALKTYERVYIRAKSIRKALKDYKKLKG